MQQNAEIVCPHCGELLEISIDPSVHSQIYVEDCQVCCKPIEIHVTFKSGEAEVSAEVTD